MTLKRKILVGTLAFLLMVRLLVPYVIRYEVNHNLATIPHYSGHLEGVHLALWRGGFTFSHLTVRHAGDDLDLHIRDLTTTINWFSLFRGALVCNLTIRKPVLLFTVTQPSKAKSKTEDAGKDAKEAVEAKTEKTLPQVVASLIPFRIDRFQLIEGQVRVRKKTGPHETSPVSSVPVVSDLNVKVENLTNSAKLSKSLTAMAQVRAKIAETGRMAMTLHFNPTATSPHFDFAVTIHEFQLSLLNDLLEWETGLHFKTGTFSLESNGTAADGMFHGRLKPFINDLAVETPAQHTVVQKLEKGVINAVARVFQNRDSKKIATEVAFEGQLDNPSADMWQAILSLLRNAFVEAIKPQVGPGTSIHPRT